MAAMLPGAAMAQLEGEGTTTYTLNATCEFGQGSPMSLPPCAFDEEAGLVTITLLNPASTTGAFEGVQVLDAVGVQNLADGSFNGSGLVFWSAPSCTTATTACARPATPVGTSSGPSRG